MSPGLGEERAWQGWGKECRELVCLPVGCLVLVWNGGCERRSSLGVQEEGDHELTLRSWKKRPSSSWIYKQQTTALLKPHESITCQEGGCWPYWAKSSPDQPWGHKVGLRSLLQEILFLRKLDLAKQDFDSTGERFPAFSSEAHSLVPGMLRGQTSGCGLLGGVISWRPTHC